MENTYIYFIFYLIIKYKLLSIYHTYNSLLLGIPQFKQSLYMVLFIEGEPQIKTFTGLPCSIIY